MKTAKPKGILMPIGGSEDKKNRKEVLCRMISETGKAKPRICIITLATDIPEEVLSDYRKAFASLKQKDISSIHYARHGEANEELYFGEVERADIILFTGGDQLRLTSLLGGTKLFQRIKERYHTDAHFVVAGTSAGAAAMSSTMIISGSSRDAMVKGELELTNGLDLINSVFIDTHVTERGRIGRITQTVTCNPGILGIGLGEDTAAMIRMGETVEVIGSGLAIVVDGTGIILSDLMDREDGEQITVEGIKLHVLGHGTQFSLSERKVLSTPKPKK